MTRRTRRRGARFPVGRTAVAVVGVLLVCAAAHLLGLLLLACLTGAGAYWAGWRRGQRSAPASPAAKAAAPRRGSPHLAPVRAGVVSLCAECAAGSCVWCNDARCDHRRTGHPNLPAPDTRPLAPVSDEPPF